MQPQRISPKELHEWIKNGSPEPVLIDVREPEELAIAAFPENVIHLPLSQSSIWVKNLGEKIPTEEPLIIICHKGIRSWNFGTWLLQQKLRYDVWNLEGGIDAWSFEIDPKTPRY